MGLLDILVTIIIAIYAMAGGALINASITAPENTKRLLSLVTDRLHNWIAFGGAFLCLLGGVLYVMIFGVTVYGTWDFVAKMPIVWLAMAHTAFAAVTWSCRKISNFLTS